MVFPYTALYLTSFPTVVKYTHSKYHSMGGVWEEPSGIESVYTVVQLSLAISRRFLSSTAGTLVLDREAASAPGSMESIMSMASYPCDRLRSFCVRSSRLIQVVAHGRIPHLWKAG